MVKKDDWSLETQPLTDEDVTRRKPREPSTLSTLLVIYARDGVQAVPLHADRTRVIGRNEPADVVIRDVSLSRQHAAVEWVDGAVWIEDLGSTNGTRVNDQRVERCRLEPGDELLLGAVPACLQAVDLMRPTDSAVEDHDRFRLALEREVARAQAFDHSLCLAMLACKDSPVQRWFPVLAAAARPFDLLALYSRDTVEWLMPETDPKQALGLLEAVLEKVAGLRCGLAGLPDNAHSAEALLSQAHRTLNMASRTTPLSLAPPSSAESLEPVEDGPVIASPAMAKLFSTVERLASSVIPVLLTGETGCGKEVVARAIHGGGPRAGKPLICVNCGGIASQLVESTLFGHEAGAFTGATGKRKGVFESADGGTVLLDEVGELPQTAQTALLRVLENRALTRVGSTDELQVDVRILAATNRDLEIRCKEGAFREDLLYRLNAMTLVIPPLRKRPEEIEPLVERFIEQANQENGCSVKDADDAAMDLLRGYPWPGNVRELRNAIARAVVIAEGEVITKDDLPDRVRAVGPGRPVTDPARADVDPGAEGAASESLKAQMARFEAERILQALVEADGERTLAAERLGLPVRTLAYKMKTLGIRRENYKRDGDD